ncbi:MAG: DMT family transporter [Pseudomonadota bacterium]|jgi:drug/metabolite transporter (DMT)-like permease|uniref:Permease of the drug/metabolite transporter (DMT) superfamily n=1 Tax=hydrothermal vent metagenome TaxID=652676 RepID=A0A160TP06_9ZZZZ
MQDKPAPTAHATLNAYIFLAIVMLFWAGNAIVGRAVRDDIPPFTLALVRWAGATAILMPFAWRRLRADAPVLRANWRIVLVLGLLGVAAFNAFLYSGLRHTTATNSMLIQAAIPAMVVLFARLIFSERAALLQVLGVIVSTVGVGWVVSRGDLATLLHLQLGTGDLLILCAVLAWSLYTVLLRLRPDVDPLSFLAATFVIATLTMLPLAAQEWLNGASVTWRPSTIGAFAYVAVLPSLIAYSLYNRAVGTLGAGRAGQMIALMPLFGALLAALLLGEALHAFHFWGMAFIVTGILLSAIAGRGLPAKG